MSKLEKVLELIGHAIHEGLNLWSSENAKTAEVISETNNFLELATNAYVFVPFPESQEYMEEEWFGEEAELADYDKHGGAAYFIPLNRVFR